MILKNSRTPPSEDFFCSPATLIRLSSQGKERHTRRALGTARLF
jgi:hypothetical protein